MEFEPECNPINLSNIKDYQEYFLLKGNTIHKIITGKIENKILIMSKCYIKLLNPNELPILLGLEYNSIYSAYEYIKYLFEENKILIKDITRNKEMKLIIVLLTYSLRIVTRFDFHYEVIFFLIEK